MSCRFTGTLNDKLRGFYRSTYTDPDGELQTIATTQFESVDARRCFPCFDEPDRKAVFEIALIVDPGVDAISNSPVVGIDDLGAKRRVRFSPTMKMSTYLVAFVIGKLEATETVDVDGVPLRVVCTPGKKNLGRFALEIGAFALRFFTEYFDIAYPGDKVDLVAIPDFAAGAMENLGCITFRDTALLIDQDQAARTELERVADVIAHELAHMWFGDLVTMGWWEGIWLNEAFATFMETLCVDAFQPVVGSLGRVRPLPRGGPGRRRRAQPPGPSSTRSARPRRPKACSTSSPTRRAAGVLRMLEQHIGPEVFRDGVRSYLKAHAYANTVTTDLWDALEEASGAPVRDVMNTFILQGGHPLVSLHGEIARPAALRPWPGATRRHLVDREHVASAGRRARPAPAGGAGATRHLVLGPRADPGIGYARGVAAGQCRRAGACSVWATRPTTVWPWPSGLDELSPLERANLLADTWATTLAGHHSAAGVPGPGLAAGHRSRPGTVGAGGQRARPHQSDRRRRTAVRAPSRPPPRCSAPRTGPSASMPRPARTNAPPPCARWPSASWARWGPTPRSGPRRHGASTSRRSVVATGPNIPADIEAATLAVVAELGAPRRLRRPPGSATGRRHAPRGDALARCPGRVRRRRPVLCAPSIWP